MEINMTAETWRDRMIHPRSFIKDRIFVLFSFLLGFLLAEWVLFEGFGLSVPAFMAAFYAAVFWYLADRPGRLDRKGMILLIPIALLTACFGFFDNEPLSGLNFLLLIALVIFQLSAMTGNRLYKTFSLGLLIDFLHAAVVLPLANIPAPFKALRRVDPKGRGNRVTSVLIGIGISLPLLILVLSLLSGADVIFEMGLKRMFEFINKNIAEYMVKVIFAAVFSIPLFGLLHALRVGDRVQSMKIRIDPAKIRVMEEGVAATVFLLLNVVYLAFIAVQFGYLFNAFSRILPEGMTYAEYARRGFFQLMGVSIINLCMLTASMLLSKRSGKVWPALLKAMETGLIVLTLLLIASAMAKMFLYVDVFGLTLLRIYASWFLLLCAVVFLAMLVKLNMPRFALTRFCAAAFLVLYLALNFANIDGWIARYNIRHYQTGKFTTVDVENFYSLSDSMIPYAAELTEDRDAQVVASAKELLANRAFILKDRRWQVQSLDRAWAVSVLESKGITYDPGTRDNMD